MPAVFQAIRRDFSMFTSSCLGISSGLHGELDWSPMVFCTNWHLELWWSTSHLDDLDKSLKKLVVYLTELVASTVYELTGKIQMLYYGQLYKQKPTVVLTKSISLQSSTYVLSIPLFIPHLFKILKSSISVFIRTFCQYEASEAWFSINAKAACCIQL